MALAYSSGRLYWSILKAMQQHPLQQPDFVVGGVGTEIRTGASGEPWREWNARFTDWNETLVRELLLRRFPVRLQPPEVLSPHKVSFYGENLSAAVLDEMAAVLQEAGLAARLVYSSARDLDVLPAAAGKGEAARFLARHLGISPEQLIASGDSGNDRCLLEQSGRGIVVANAQPELHDLRGPTIYHSPECYAAGVLDGVLYWLRDSTSHAQPTSKRR
jgi:mannosylfructose-6-phosphate phosphatase